MEELINNIMQTPENTNPNVLRGQLESIGSNSNSNSGILVVEDNDGTLNKTFQEIYDALGNGQLVVIKSSYLNEGNIPTYTLVQVTSAGPDQLNSSAYVVFIDGDPYYADAMDDYPSGEIGGVSDDDGSGVN